MPVPALQRTRRGFRLVPLTTAPTVMATVAFNGQKAWKMNGRIADWGICMARPRCCAAQGDLVLPRRHAPSRHRRAASAPADQGGSDFDEVFLDDVAVPASCLLGGEDEGWGVGMATLTNERGHIGASAISSRGGWPVSRAAELAVGDTRPRPPPTSCSRSSAIGRTYLALAQRQGAVASLAGSLMKLGVTELLFDTAALRTELAGADGMLENDASPASTRPCWPHRRRHDAGAEEHHRRAHPRTAQGAKTMTSK